MSASSFRCFCGDLAVDNAPEISTRYKAITRRLNIDFWDSLSETNHSHYVGSYGRDTAIRDFHDLDVLFQLPTRYYDRFHSYAGNGQSALLQEVRASLRKTYSGTQIGGDGQVVVVRFADRMRFEIIPAFAAKEGKYLFADSNEGGVWKVTDPLPEIAAINAANKACGGNLKMLCRMARAWRRQWKVDMGGLLIDTLACSFLMRWPHKEKTYTHYGLMSCEFFEYLSMQERTQKYWLAPGSGQRVLKKGAFRDKAKQCALLARQALTHEDAKRDHKAALTWRRIYGAAYPL